MKKPHPSKKKLYHKNFIAIEGGEGSGKTTQIERLKEKIKKLNLENQYYFAKEPGGTKEAQKIREILLNGFEWNGMEELLLFNTARFNNLINNVIPALQNNKIVIIDRYILSTLSMQTQRGVKEKLIYHLHKKICFNLFPAKTLYLDIDPEIAVKRSLERQKNPNEAKEDRFENYPMEFHKNVREYCLKNKKENIIPIDANTSIEEISKKIEKEINLIP